LAPKPVRANRLVALIVLGIMASTAATGLVYALLTQGQRRAHDTGLTHRLHRPGLPSRPVEEPDLTVAPARLAALGYLPPDIGVLVGLHVAELKAGPAGQELLNQSFRVGDNDYRIDRVLGWTSLKLDDIDHAVLALNPEILPSATLVVRTRRPYNEKEVREALEARRIGEGKKAIYRVSIPNSPLPAALFCPDDRTLVLGLSTERIKAVPDRPVEGLGHLPEEVRNVLEERMGPGGPLWVAGHVRNWNETAAGLLWQKVPPANLERLKSIRTFAIWVQPGRPAPGAPIPLTIQAALACSSPEAARELDEKVLQPWLHPKEAPGKGARVVREGAWLTIQDKTDTSTLRQ
jgi:hypothetical protein